MDYDSSFIFFLFISFKQNQIPEWSIKCVLKTLCSAFSTLKKNHFAHQTVRVPYFYLEMLQQYFLMTACISILQQYHECNKRKTPRNYFTFSVKIFHNILLRDVAKISSAPSLSSSKKLYIDVMSYGPFINSISTRKISSVLCATEIAGEIKSKIRWEILRNIVYATLAIALQGGVVYNDDTKEWYFGKVIANDSIIWTCLCLLRRIQMFYV